MCYVRTPDSGGVFVGLDDVRSSDLATWLFEHDIVCLQESHLWPDQELSLPYPDTHRCVARSRPVVSMRQPGGGVLVFVRSTVTFDVRAGLSGPDLIVLDLVPILLVVAYVAPAGSPWLAATPLPPVARFCEIVTLRAAMDRPLLVVGDLNGRIGTSSPSTQWPRVSSDCTSNARGSALLDLCTSSGLAILNGSTFDASTMPGSFTSFQPRGSAVVDYAFASASLLPLLSRAWLWV
ncbi:hypothetical protein BV25DRAFT_1921180 [Artomyces pyxidatus]|uniref:Uncharacterized protein n=1 Tax=Artomyces pyxidatus TaxID=48021 RepID=A0ACB8SJV8_9AGAM|nr:hypothetical protein BV25DRAFT_1921180 [Artomyces pyxidatus]